MKNASSALTNFLLFASSYARADFYTITLNGGTVLRCCSAPGLILVNGFNYGNGPIVQDSGVKSLRGLEVTELDITFYAGDSHTVNGVPFLDFVENLGMEGATFLVERGFASDWLTMRSTGPIGTYIRFSGVFSEAKELGQTQVVITIASPLQEFTRNIPADTYQTSCQNVLGDAKCLVNMSSFAASGIVAASPAPTGNTFGSNLTPAVNDYALGKVVFTSGPNNGLAFTVKTQDGSGNFNLNIALPFPPSSGDTFVAYPGCDLTMSRCTTKFNNLIHYRGEPFIPDPATGLPS